MGAVRALARLEVLQILRSGVKSGRPGPGVQSSGRPLLLLAILLFLGWQIYRLADSWVAQQAGAREVVFLLFQPALTTLGSAAVVVIFFYGFTRLISVFTDQGDLQLLLLAPIRPEIVLGEKLLLTCLGFSGMLLITLPACYAVGSAVGAAPAYYVAVLVAILLLPVAPVSLGALVLMGLLHRLPPARARTISSAIGMLIGLTFVAATQLQRAAAGARFPDLAAWVPSGWPGRFVADAGLGNGSEALLYATLTALLAIVLFAAATAAATRVLTTGAASYGEVGRSARDPAPLPVASREPTRVAPPDAAAAGHPAARPPWWSILRRDARALRRDPQRLMTFLYPLVIVGINAFGLASRASTGQSSGTVGPTIFLLILAALLLVNTTVPGILNGEGKAIVVLALAPISTGDILKAKWIAAAVPPIALVELAVAGLGVYLGVPPAELALLALSLGALTATLATVTLTINIGWPKLEGASARRPASGMATLVSFATDAALSVFVGVMLILALFAWNGTAAVLAGGALFVGLGIVTAVTLPLSHVLLRRLLCGGSALR